MAQLRIISDTITFRVQKRAAIYLRVSGKKQEEGYSLNSQIDYCLKRCEEQGYVVEERHIYREVHTGVVYRERPKLNALRAAARNHEFDVVVIYDFDRLAREDAHQTVIMQDLKENGVSVEAVKRNIEDTPAGRFLLHTYGFMAEVEREKILQRCEDGRQKRLAENKLLGFGQAKYGYKWNDKRDAWLWNTDMFSAADGTQWSEFAIVQRIFTLSKEGGTLQGIMFLFHEEGIPTRNGAKWDAGLVKRILRDREKYFVSEEPLLALGELMLDEQGAPWTEASVSRLISTMADTGSNEHTIAAYLTEHHVPTGRTMWSRSSIRAILSDPCYKGVAEQYKTRSVHEPGKPSRQEKRPEEERIRIRTGVIPPIIDEETFAIVQEQLRRNKENAARSNQHPEEALLRSGHVFCGYCGSRMNAHHRDDGSGSDYRCKKGNIRTGECRKVTIACRIADEAAWQNAIKIIKDPRQVRQKLEKRKQEHPPDNDLLYVDIELSRIASEVQNLVLLGQTVPNKQVLGSIGGVLNELDRQRGNLETMRKSLIDIEEKKKGEEEAIAQFEKQCVIWRQKLRSSNPQFSYEEKRKAIEYFGIKAVAWRADHTPRVEITSDPPALVSIWLQPGAASCRITGGRRADRGNGA